MGESDSVHLGTLTEPGRLAKAGGKCEAPFVARVPVGRYRLSDAAGRPLAAQAPKRPMSFLDMQLMKQVGGTALSPDGYRPSIGALMLRDL